jgi:hypothetical protein
VNDRRVVLITIGSALGAALAAMLIIVAAGWSPNVGYLLALAAVGAVLVLALRRLLDGIAPPMWTRPTTPGAPPGGTDPRIATIELTLRRGAEDTGLCRRRLQPMLFDLATHRLRQHHGVELIEDPDEARALLGDETFRFLTDVVTEPIPPAALARAVHAIEEL